MADQQQDQSSEERTEQATPKRREDARRRGQVARSRELTTSAILLVTAAGFLFLGPGMFDGLARVMRQGLGRAGERGADPGAAFDALVASMSEALWTLAPFFALATVAALLGPLALGGWAASGSNVQAKAERIDPVKGMKRVFSWRGLMEMAKALAKFLVILGAALAVLWTGRDGLLALGLEGWREGTRDAGSIVTLSFLLLAASTLLIAAVDVPFQLWSYARQLRMTRQELKEEFKHTEGRPEVKSRIRTLQRELATRRMMEEVPKADVVVTNPTHYAVALRYRPGEMGAPRLVARGAGEVARRIREVARANHVTVLHSPPLARAIYHSTRLDREIPAGLYRAVAEVLAYVYRLREAPATPAPDPGELEIPEELRREQ